MNNNIEVQPEALFKISYGLYLVSARSDNKDNACIINAFFQITDTPKRVCIAINKKSYTHSIIFKEGNFNVSILSSDAKIELIAHFGYASGHDTDKFEGFTDAERSANGLFRLNKSANGFISARVVSMLDYDTHTLFVGEVTQAEVLSEVPSMTYAYYLENVKV